MAVEQGDVYFTVHRGPTSPKPHFCIVMNGGADVTKRVVLSFASSQFETRLAIAKRNHYPKETLVQVAPSQYDAFDRFTVIDCNSVYVGDAEEFEAGLKASHARKKRKLPRAILERVIRGIHASPRATAEMKALIGPPPTPTTVLPSDLRAIKISVK